MLSTQYSLSPRRHWQSFKQKAHDVMLVGVETRRLLDYKKNSSQSLYFAYLYSYFRGHNIQNAVYPSKYSGLWIAPEYLNTTLGNIMKSIKDIYIFVKHQPKTLLFTSNRKKKKRKNNKNPQLNVLKRDREIRFCLNWSLTLKIKSSFFVWGGTV